MINECIYRTEDSGCKKLYIFCPKIINDAADLGCGGVCVEVEIEEDSDKE